MTKLALLANAASSHTQKWATDLARRGWEIKVFSFLPGEIPGVEVVVIPKLFGGKADAILRLRWVKKYLETWQPDLVHAHYATSFGLLGALSGLHPFVISAWGSDIFSFPKTSVLHRRLLSWILGQADILCSTSHIMAQEMTYYIPAAKPLQIIPFGVDVERFAPRRESASEPSKGVTEEPVTYGVAKYLYAIYGLDLLLRAFAEVSKRHPGKVRLRLAGDGPEKENLRSLASELQIEEEIDWVGPLRNDQVADFYRALDIVVIPSRQESFGVTAVEGAACGLPVIASRIGGLPEVVLDQETGLLVPAEDVAALTAAMERLLHNPEERQHFGQAGRAFVLKNYDWQENVSQMENVYTQLLASKKEGLGRR